MEKFASGPDNSSAEGAAKPSPTAIALSDFGVADREEMPIETTTSRRLTIALDIDDTITANPAFFAFLSQAAVAAGHKVLIITFREDRAEAASDLRDRGIAWTKLVTSSLEEHIKHGVDQWKGWVCRKHKVDIFFDDMPEVLKHVDSTVTRCLIH